MRSYATEDNPELMLAEQQLGALKAQLAKLAGAGNSSDSDHHGAQGQHPGGGNGISP